MTSAWTKLGVEFDALTDALSDTAVRLHVCALGHSNRHLLDGIVPEADLPLFSRNVRGDVEQAVAELLDTGWWMPAAAAIRGNPAPGWNVLGKCGKWQRTRAQVLGDQAANRRRVANWRLEKCAAGEHSRHCPPASCPEKRRSDAVLRDLPLTAPTSLTTDRPTGNAITQSAGGVL